MNEFDNIWEEFWVKMNKDQFLAKDAIKKFSNNYVLGVDPINKEEINNMETKTIESKDLSWNTIPKSTKEKYAVVPIINKHVLITTERDTYCISYCNQYVDYYDNIISNEDIVLSEEELINKLNNITKADFKILTILDKIVELFGDKFAKQYSIDIKSDRYFKLVELWDNNFKELEEYYVLDRLFNDWVVWSSTGNRQSLYDRLSGQSDFKSAKKVIDEYYNTEFS